MCDDVSTLDIVLFNLLSFMGGVFSGMFAGIQLRNTMLRSRSRDNISQMNHHTLTSNQRPYRPEDLDRDRDIMPIASAPLANAVHAESYPKESYPKESYSKQEIVIRTTE